MITTNIDIKNPLPPFIVKNETFLLQETFDSSPIQILKMGFVHTHFSVTKTTAGDGNKPKGSKAQIEAGKGQFWPTLSITMCFQGTIR